MKTYFLFFEGDPKPHLEPLQMMGPIQIVPVFDSLHCISFGPNHFEQTILNALKQSSSAAYLVKASLPVFPEPPKTVLSEIHPLIDEADDNSALFSGH